MRACRRRRDWRADCGEAVQNAESILRLPSSAEPPAINSVRSRPSSWCRLDSSVSPDLHSDHSLASLLTLVTTAQTQGSRGACYDDWVTAQMIVRPDPGRHMVCHILTQNKTQTENLDRYGDSLKTDGVRRRRSATYHPGPAPRSPSQSKRDASHKRSGGDAELMAMPPPRTLGRREEGSPSSSVY